MIANQGMILLEQAVAIVASIPIYVSNIGQDRVKIHHASEQLMPNLDHTLYSLQ